MSEHRTPTEPAEQHPDEQARLTARPLHEIRALHTADTVTVYQAYHPRIGLPAARDGRFPEAWKRERMTWVTPRS